METASARSKRDRRQKAACVMITGAMRTTPTEVLKMLFYLPQLDTAVEAAAVAVAYFFCQDQTEGSKRRARTDYDGDKKGGQVVHNVKRPQSP